MSCVIKLIRTGNDIERFLAFANPILSVDMEDPYMREMYGTDRLWREIAEGQRVGFVTTDDGTIIAGALAKVLDDKDKADRRINDPRSLVLLEYWAVAEDRRRQGLITSLIRRCEDWARDKKAHGLVTKVELANPTSLRVAFGHGFVATHLLHASLGIPGDFQILRKQL